MRVLPRGLRARSTLGFAFLGLVLSVTLSITTYQVARWYLLDQRQTFAARQAVLHAQVLSGQLTRRAPRGDDEVLAVLAETRSRAVLLVGGNWYSTVVDFNESRVPRQMLDRLDEHVPLQQRIRVNGVPHIVVSVPLTSIDGSYVEFVPAIEYERTLRTLAWVLAGAATVTTALGAVSGWVLSRRVLQPLEHVAASAQAMSAGDLRQRLDVGDDPDLLPVADSFNTMAESLEQRIQREQRFTADVSHELRTPLTAMSSAVALAQRSGSQERTSFAIDVLADQVDHLRKLTLELLELARIDAGRADVAPELVDVAALVARQAEVHGATGALAPSTVPVVHEVNPIRMERIVANLLENAERYGGGATRIECSHVGTDLVVTVDDAGPGVPAHERESIFGRFHRGTATAPPGLPKGTGLGLSLVDEFVRLEGGRVWVDESPQGGARFTVQIPRRP